MLAISLDIEIPAAIGHVIEASLFSLTMEVGFGANLCSKVGGHSRTASMEGERHEAMGGNAPRRHHQQATVRGELGVAPGKEGQLLLGVRHIRKVYRYLTNMFQIVYHEKY